MTSIWEHKKPLIFYWNIEINESFLEKILQSSKKKLKVKWWEVWIDPKPSIFDICWDYVLNFCINFPEEEKDWIFTDTTK